MSTTFLHEIHSTNHSYGVLKLKHLHPFFWPISRMWVTSAESFCAFTSIVRSEFTIVQSLWQWRCRHNSHAWKNCWTSKEVFAPQAHIFSWDKEGKTRLTWYWPHEFAFTLTIIPFLHIRVGSSWHSHMSYWLVIVANQVMYGVPWVWYWMQLICQMSTDIDRR
jgi:hypothetical protein